MKNDDKDNGSALLWTCIFITVIICFGLFCRTVCNAQIKQTGSFLKKIALYTTDDSNLLVPSPTKLAFMWGVTSHGADAIQFTKKPYKDYGYKLKLFGNHNDWHLWRDASDIMSIWWGGMLLRKVIYDNITKRELIVILARSAAAKYLERIIFKWNMHGVSWDTYANKKYNQGAIVYPKISFNPLSLTDGKFRLGGWSMVSMDLLMVSVLMFVK